MSAYVCKREEKEKDKLKLDSRKNQELKKLLLKVSISTII